MSRIGRMPIAIPAGVTVEVAENNKVTVKGPKGTLERVLPAEMEIKVEGAEVVVYDLYKLEKFTGCISCFGCKLPQTQGICIYKD